MKNGSMAHLGARRNGKKKVGKTTHRPRHGRQTCGHGAGTNGNTQRSNGEVKQDTRSNGLKK